MFNETSGSRRGERPRSRGHHFDGGFGDVPPGARGRGRDRGFGFERHGRGMSSGPGFGGMFGRGFGGMFGRGPAVRRGDVRAAILAVLADRPMHGYQIMQELRQLSGGAWAPSAGSVYPTLQQLEDEGLVRGVDQDGRRVFTLTDEGEAAAVKARAAGAPWEVDGDRAASDIRTLIAQVAQAAMQVSRVGTTATAVEARRILVAARRDLYRLLADDDADDAVDGAAGDAAGPGGAGD